jgi:hypothetical protein
MQTIEIDSVETLSLMTKSIDFQHKKVRKMFIQNVYIM